MKRTGTINVKGGADWRDRAIVVSHVYFALCISEAQYKVEMKKMHVPPELQTTWCREGGARTHHLVDPSTGCEASVVCIWPWPEASPVSIAGTLVHEAVHVWQRNRDGIGEHNPSSEFEAYAIQAYSEELLRSYAEQTASKPRRRAKA